MTITWMPSTSNIAVLTDIDRQIVLDRDRHCGTCRRSGPAPWRRCAPACRKRRTDAPAEGLHPSSRRCRRVARARDQIGIPEEAEHARHVGLRIQQGAEQGRRVADAAGERIVGGIGDRRRLDRRASPRPSAMRVGRRGRPRCRSARCRAAISAASAFAARCASVRSPSAKTMAVGPAKGESP